LEEFAASDQTVSAELLNFEMKNPAASGLRGEAKPYSGIFRIKTWYLAMEKET
jgi:hypothetical protein